MMEDGTFVGVRMTIDFTLSTVDMKDIVESSTRSKVSSITMFCINEDKKISYPKFSLEAVGESVLTSVEEVKEDMIIPLLEMFLREKTFVNAA